MTVPLVVLAVPSIRRRLVQRPAGVPCIGIFSEWLGPCRCVPIEDEPPRGDRSRAGWERVCCAALLGIALGWLVWGTDRATQAERDRFEVPGPLSAPATQVLPRRSLTGRHRRSRSRARRPGVNWINDYVIDSIVNGAAFAHQGLGSFVYGVVDQSGIDGVDPWSASPRADGAGSALRQLQTGRVQQYAAGFVGRGVGAGRPGSFFVFGIGEADTDGTVRNAGDSPSSCSCRWLGALLMLLIPKTNETALKGHRGCWSPWPLRRLPRW